MIKEIYFDCPRKGKVLALVFDDAEDITTVKLQKYLNCDSDRYIKIVLRKGDQMACQTAIKFEMDREKTIENRKNLVKNDLEDLIKIKNGL